MMFLLKDNKKRRSSDRETALFNERLCSFTATILLFKYKFVNDKKYFSQKNFKKFPKKSLTRKIQSYIMSL
ncbi:MAG: hypothetical protein DBX59_08710 [Bacillota bacterium]|nr:MAG: hypothetical protein DBX59_08710 [Bacillota bacterium]